MGDELSLARQKEEGYAKLLARISGRVPRPKSSNRDKREKAATTSRRDEAGAVKDTTPESEDSSKIKGTDARRANKPKGYRRNNKDRKQNRIYEGEDTIPRRSAQELGVIFPGSYCDDTSTKLSPHYWVKTDTINSGGIFQCKKCNNHLWLPIEVEGATALGYLMDRFGRYEGYYRYLNHASRRPAKIMVAKLQEIYRLSKNITNIIEFAKMVDKILNEKDYDRR